MNFALGHCFSPANIFEKFPFEKLKTHYTNMYKTSLIHGKIKLCMSIFADCVKLVLNDVINNDVTFRLPTTGRPADIRMIKIEDEAFRRARSYGKFKEVDFLASNFKGYQLGLYMYGTGRTRVKTIYVDKNLKSQITKHTNEGHDYA